MSKRPEESLLRRQRRREGAWSPGNTRPTGLARQGSPAKEDAEQFSAGRRNMSQPLRGGLHVLEAERTSPDAHHLRAGEHTAPRTTQQPTGMPAQGPPHVRATAPRKPDQRLCRASGSTQRSEKTALMLESRLQAADGRRRACQATCCLTGATTARASGPPNPSDSTLHPASVTSTCTHLEDQ